MNARLPPALLLVCACLTAVACGGSSTSASTTRAPTASTQTTASATTPGPEGVPLEQGAALAPASTTTPGAPVDGVQCAPIEQLAYHIHAHVRVFVDGQPRSIPAAIGLLGPVQQQTANGPFYGAQQCYYWLHTHSSDGILHIESPTKRIYTLGNFFDEWRQPLGSGQVGPATGSVTAFLNGKPWTGNPRTIPLLPHAVIQLDVGSPAVAFQPMSWAGVQL
jgi:hypothetical protein